MGTRKTTTGAQHSFAQIPSADIQRSQFNRSCGLKTTFDSGKLIPIFCDEALPGDTMSLRLSTFARLATPLHPIMDNIYMDTHFFSVPIRLIWDNWQKFNGEQANPDDSTDFLVPETEAPASVGHVEGSLSDYFGIPTGVPELKHTSLWHRAYHLIWNEWFRDQNLQDSVVVDKGDGPDTCGDYTIQRRGKRHDYFSSCLPFPQKGPAVSLPLGGTAPVLLDVGQMTMAWGNGSPAFNVGPGQQAGLSNDASATIKAGFSGNPGADTGPILWGDPAILSNVDGVTGVADLSAATSATINSIRVAFQVQKLYERDARGGTRYTEIIRAHFGVVSPDQRLQRPEFLGGGSTSVNINPVPQVSSTDGTSPQGNLAGFGVASSTGSGFTKSFVEHCVIIGLISVRADLNYQQGLPRMFSRRTRWDFYWPALANIGEQAVLNKEIYADNSANDDLTFGYQERFAEYRYKPSQITGQMRSQFAQSLDTWHLAQDFATLPVLDSDFIEENPPIARIIAVPSEPEFLLDCFFDYKCARPMPVYSVPGLIDHF